MISLELSDRPTPSVGAAISMQRPDSFLKHSRALKFCTSLCIRFTEIDRAFLVWGVLTLIIFSLAQFSSINWTTQAILDAALAGAGIAITSGLTWAIASSAQLLWVIFLWAGLVSTGAIVTAYGIFCSDVWILSNLCLLWLGLCAIGYGVMAAGMRSRCFTAACLVHLGATIFFQKGLVIEFLSITSWQFFYSGLVIASTLFFFSVVPWDRQPSDSDT